MSKIFYFDEKDAFGDNIKTPLENEDIIIPIDTTIIITKYIISPNSYRKLLIPHSSKLIFETTDTILYIKDNIIIEGEVITTNNSEIVNADISGNILQYKYWHNLSSWYNFKIPESGEDIIISEDTNLVITNRTKFNNEKFGKLKIPNSSKLIIDIQNFKLNVSELIHTSDSGSIIFSTGSTIEVSPPYNSYITRYWHDKYSWDNETIPQIGDDVIIPPYTKMILHWKSNTFSNFFKSVTVPETSQLIIDLVFFTLKAETFYINGSIKLNEGSKLETLVIVYNYEVNLQVDIDSTGVFYESLRFSTNQQKNILSKTLIDYYNISEEQLFYSSVSFNNNIVSIKFRIKVNSEDDALQIIHLTKTNFDNISCVNDNNNDSKLIEYLITSFNSELNADLELEDIENLKITSKYKIFSTDPEKLPPKIIIWNIFPDNKYLKTYYFDDPNAWDNNQVPQNGEDIIIPQNVIIQLTQYSILAPKYNNLIIPKNSQLYFINDNIDLYVNNIDNRGIIRSSKNSSIISSPTKSNPDFFYNWNDTLAWGGNSPPNAGEDIIIPDNTHIVITYQSGISEVGYKKLIIPQTSSIKFDIKYFHLYVQSTNINGTLTMGESNTLSLKPYVALTRTYLPIYLDSTGKTTRNNDFVSYINSDYNFTLSAVHTKALDISKFIKYRNINGNTSFVYESKQISIIENSIKNDIISQPLFHVEQKFVSDYNTSSNTLSNMYIQYITDILVGNPSAVQIISNSNEIGSIIVNSKIEKQITTILKEGLSEIQYKMENIYLNSMYNQIVNEMPQRISNRKDYEIYYFPIYNGDDLSIFVKMQANLVLSTHNYKTLKDLYSLNVNQNNNKIEFIDLGCKIRINPSVWRIFINLR